VRGREASQPIGLFSSYSHRDERLRKRLEMHFAYADRLKALDVPLSAVSGAGGTAMMYFIIHPWM
jgi:hypothetical protein